VEHRREGKKYFFKEEVSRKVMMKLRYRTYSITVLQEICFMSGEQSKRQFNLTAIAELQN
jgi:hypothetical protein